MRHNNKNQCLKLLAPVAFSLLFIAAAFVSVSATVSSFTSRTFYTAAVSSMGTTKNIDFSTRDDAQPITSPDADLHVTSMFLKGAEFVEQRTYYNRMFYNFPHFKSRVYLPANTYAFGVELTRFYGIDGDFTITLSTGDTYTLTGKPNVHYFTFPPNPDFFGITSDQPVQWAEYSFDNDYMVLDNFTYTVNTPNQISGLVSYWSAENTSVDFKDGNDGVLRLGTAFTPGVYRKAFKFDGLDDRVSVPNSTNLNVGTGDFTVSFFARFNDLANNGNGLIHKDTYGNESGYRGWLFNICDTCPGGGGIGIETRNLGQGIDNNARYPTSNFVVGRWYHIAAVRKSNVLYLYIDGELKKAVAESSPTNLSNTADLEFGSLSSGSRQNFDGALDEIRFYNRALSDADIQTLAVFDSTPPVIAPVVTGTLGSNDWYTSNVQVNWNVSDAESSVDSSTGCETANVTADTNGVTFTCAATSVGGSSAQSVTIKRDASAPVINSSAKVNGLPYGGGWTNQNVAVSFSCSDALSGVAFLTDPITLGNEGAGQSATGTCTDAAGNSSEASASGIDIDKTAPEINCGAADGAWHAADVSIACTSSENLSGLMNPADANFNLVTNIPAGFETSNALTGSRSVCDLAINCASSGIIGGNKIDRKAPSITITAPTAGNYLLNQAVAVSYSCTDGGSGVGNCTGTSPNGGLLDTSSGGAKSFTVSATDNVGNQAVPSSVSYTVGYNLDVLFDQTKAHKAGSTVPVKIRLLDANGFNASSAGTVLHAVSVIQIGSQASAVLEDAGSSNPDFDFRFDQDSASYIFNLQTKGYRTGTYQLNFIAGNGAVIYSVRFQIRQ